MAEPPTPNTENMSERRRGPRFPCAVGITIEWGAAALHGSVVEISAEGMFVELDQPLWIGARFAARLELEKPVQVECVVRRVQPLRGMGATYSITDEAQRDAIATLIEKLSRE